MSSKRLMPKQKPPRTRTEALAYVYEHPDDFREGFDDWLLDNFDIQLFFNKEAVAIAKTGRQHYSAYTLVEYLRHHTMLRSTDADFKINNLFRASMSRLFAAMHPEYKDLFAYRTLFCRRVCDVSLQTKGVQPLVGQPVSP